MTKKTYFLGFFNFQKIYKKDGKKLGYKKIMNCHSYMYLFNHKKFMNIISRLK